MTLELLIVPCLADNYAYLLHDAGSDTTAIVDVPEAAPVQQLLAERGWRLDTIVLTHHHNDHIAGVAALAGATGAAVIGAEADAHRLPPLTRAVHPGQVIEVAGHRTEILDAAGHTLGHIAFHMPRAGLLFSGDSLMSWGCGRLFEGSPAQMLATLTRMAALPGDTLICSGHEYTEANGRFALSLEPEAPALRARMAEVKALRAEGRPTVPARLDQELATNPFLRGADPALKRALGLPPEASALDTFTEARARKDRF